jgi:hypothetical protein
LKEQRVDCSGAGEYDASMRITSTLLALVSVLAGCPRKAEDRPAAADMSLEPIVSPVGNQPYAAAGAAAQPVVLAPPDARSDVASPARPDARLVAPDTGSVLSDAAAAAAARVAAQASVDRAVDRVISSASASLRSCFDRDPKALRRATLRLSVRAGYVTTADISGTSDPVRLCLEQTFRGVKFEGSAAAAASVERTLEFAR